MRSLKLLHPPHPLVNVATDEWGWVSRNRDHYNLWMCFEGSGTLTVDGVSYDVSPGFAILLLPDEEVKGRKPPETHFVNMGLHFQVEDPQQNAALVGMEDRAVRLKHIVVARELAGYLERLVYHRDQVYQEESARAAEVLLDLYLQDRSLGPEDPVELRLQKCASSLRAAPQNNWKLPELAQTAGLSVSQFGRRFRATFGCTAVEYLVQCRMDRARILLQESPLSVGQISEELGYRDVGYFSRQFKQRTGRSPLDYRRLGALSEKELPT